MLFYGRRQGGSDARNCCLLRSIDGSGSQEVDMAVTSEQRDQGQQDGGDGREPSLTIEHNRSQLLRIPAWDERPGANIGTTTEFWIQTLDRPGFSHP